MECAHKVFSSDGVLTVDTPSVISLVSNWRQLVDDRAQNYAVTCCTAPNSVVLRSNCQNKTRSVKGGKNC